MKRKISTNDELVTKGYLREEFEKFGEAVDEKAREYRDEILDKMGELENHRIERLALRNDVENLDKRVTALESAK